MSSDLEIPLKQQQRPLSRPRSLRILSLVDIRRRFILFLFRQLLVNIQSLEQRLRQAVFLLRCLILIDCGRKYSRHSNKNLVGATSPFIASSITASVMFIASSPTILAMSFLTSAGSSGFFFAFALPFSVLPALFAFFLIIANTRIPYEFATKNKGRALKRALLGKISFFLTL
jgi:hypothetical protein